MHSQRVTLLLTHDKPLPKYLHQANQSGRFQSIICRQAAVVLYTMLKNWATFVLVENHTYVQFIYRESEKPPVSFSVIRINYKALCFVLNVAFAGGTEGVVRHNVVMDLVERLSALTLPNRPTEFRERPCCTIIRKPLERILIRYEKMPTDFNTVVYPDGTQPHSVKGSHHQVHYAGGIPPGGILTTTLSRYLYHFRWLWNIKRPSIQTVPGIIVPKLNVTDVATILSTITKMRLKEGFNFAYSAAGIINMVLEVQMKGSLNDYHPCVLQYIIFPPHTTTTSPLLEKDSETENETADDGNGDGEGCNEENETLGDYQIVTEIWIEPQFGKVKSLRPPAGYMDSLEYYELPEIISCVDGNCINALLTLEHLCLLGQEENKEEIVVPTSSIINQQYGQANPPGGHHTHSNRGPSRRTSVPNFPQSRATLNEGNYRDDIKEIDRINHKIFNFDPLSILPKCQQAELLFSMFADNSERFFHDDASYDMNSILMEGLMDKMKKLHQKELILSSLESEKFTEMLFSRPRDEATPYPFPTDTTEKQRKEIRWRCFIKGISSTHIIMTIVPMSEKDVRALMNPFNSRHHQKYNCRGGGDDSSKLLLTDDKLSFVGCSGGGGGGSLSWSDSLKFNVPLRMLDFETNFSNRPGTAESTPKSERRRRTPSFGAGKSGLILPIYVYDCSLSHLTESFIEKLEMPKSKDIYQNNLFPSSNSSGGPGNLQDHHQKVTSPEPKSEESDNNKISAEQKILLEHCKLLNLAHCHCYVVAVYKSLTVQLQMSYEDMEAAVDQCEEAMIEINITDYLKTVCKHMTDDDDDDDKTCEDADAACLEYQPLHNLIKDKFRRMMNVAFKPVPAHPEFYYCSPINSMIHCPERLDNHNFHRSEDSEDDNDDGKEDDHPHNDDADFPKQSSDYKLSTSSLLLDNLRKNNTQSANTIWPHASSSTINNNLNNNNNNNNIKKKKKKLKIYDSNESLISDLNENLRNSKEYPLFLHLRCSIRFHQSEVSSIPVKLLPTCYAAIKKSFAHSDEFNLDKIKITLDIICLNLPKDVLEVSFERSSYSRKNYHAFESSSSLGAGSRRDRHDTLNTDDNKNSPGSIHETSSLLGEYGAFKEKISHLPRHQHNAITNLTSEIEWLLKDEIATALLDTSPPTEETLNFISAHVSESSGRSSCHVDRVPLHFVFSSANSAPKFFDELVKMSIGRYKIAQSNNFLYFIKDKNYDEDSEEKSTKILLDDQRNMSTSKKYERLLDYLDVSHPLPLMDYIDDYNGSSSTTTTTTANATTATIATTTINSSSIGNPPLRQDSSDPPGCNSEISSIDEAHPGTDDGYEGDSSNSEDDCCWLIDLDKRRDSLPNFWLILQVQRSHVDVYFHCRFLEYASAEVDSYRQIQKQVVSQISAICKRVNQYLLLESLHDTRNCDPLLEPESNSDDKNWRGGGGEIKNNETTFVQRHYEQQQTSSNMPPGIFRCSVVWQVPFKLHPRLKTGPGRSGLSRGIKALHVVLNRFSVNNRSNMFVYRENTSNVFYLRLHEQTNYELGHKLLCSQLSESDERLMMVSRSSSVASLSQSRNSSLHANEPGRLFDDTRPRVRSFGEKDSDYHQQQQHLYHHRNQQQQSNRVMYHDSIVLMIHGISEPGHEVRDELVQVLQNRLDDAVLEVLSVMLARNPMCKLTPADVHFIQKPFGSPESYVQFSVQSYYLKHLDALSYYLKQNILQFLNIPKYTDHRSEYHLQDYSQQQQNDDADIFLYNQSQSSGNKGIACIAMAVNNRQPQKVEDSPEFPKFLKILDFSQIVATNVFKSTMAPSSLPASTIAASVNTPIEFRIWKQGRVNLETLIDKLKGAINHAIWDLVTEYYLLPVPLTLTNDGQEKSEVSNISKSDNENLIVENDTEDDNEESVDDDEEDSDENKKESIGTKEDDSSDDEFSQLNQVYHKTLPCWFEFALEIGVPSVKKHIVKLNNRHSIPTIVREMENLIKINAPDTATKAFALKQEQPFVVDNTILNNTTLPFTNTQEFESDNDDDGDNEEEKEEEEDPITYVPWKFHLDDDHKTNYTQSLIIARNFSQCIASKSDVDVDADGEADDGNANNSNGNSDGNGDCNNIPDLSEILIPKHKKLLQKYTSLVQKSSFIPRQRLLLSRIQDDKIIIYMYNWSKDRSEKLVKQTTSLGSWLSSRSTIFNNILMQKLGIFHHPHHQAGITDSHGRTLSAYHHHHYHHHQQQQHQHHFNQQIHQKEEASTSSGSVQITDIESLAKFSIAATEGKEWSSTSRSNVSHLNRSTTSTSNTNTSINTNMNMSNSSNSSTNSQTSKSNPHQVWDRIIGQSMRDLKPTMNYPTKILDPVVRGIYDLQDLHSRERKNKEDLTRLHMSWQSRSAAPSIPMSYQVLQTFKQHSRLIHYCQTPILFLPEWRLQSAATRDHSLSPSSPLSPGIPSPNQTCHTPTKKSNEMSACEMKINAWHQELCASMLADYKQYLQILGFHSVHIDHDHNSSTSTSSSSSKSSTNQSQQICYLKKSMLGGILLFEIHLNEPFFIAKIRIIECNRMQTKANATLVNQFMLSFVDAVDKIKINMHLHSFTYDFHLRCIHSYLAGSGQWPLHQSYHLTHFFEDFIKYYSKAPNYARNLIYSDSIAIKNLRTPANTLYSYLLSHEKTYGMQVFSMLADSQDTRDTEYVLVRLQSTPLVGYCDAQDTKYTDDFTVNLVVSKQDLLLGLEKSEICLKFYLILTSKREMYPKREVENNQLGKFRTVHTIGRPTIETSSLDSGKKNETPTIVENQTTKNDDNVIITPPANDDNQDEEQDDENKNNPEDPPTTEQDEQNPEDDGAFLKIEETEKSHMLAPTPPPVPNVPLIASTNHPSTSQNLMQIRRESVNYLGYYSSHEQLMQQLIISQAQAARKHVTKMIEQGTVHCRTHLLWNKLLENRSTMTYTEFLELRSLAEVESLSSIDERLTPLMNQTVSWYQSLAKVLQNKYQEHHKQFSTSDGNVTHHLILHPSYLQAFMMLSIDLHTSRCELFSVRRKSMEPSSSSSTNTLFNLSEIHSLIEGFVNACCFHLWMGLYNQ